MSRRGEWTKVGSACRSGFWGTTAMVFPDPGITIAISVTEQSELRLSNAIMSAVLALLGVGR